tara:strand:- start:2206 stop:3246 length:1041 start_codon:yes stop_codon:yes gene_type:complete
MAEIIQISADKNSDFVEKLRNAVQSARLNFLFGAGASAPTIAVVGDVEILIDKLVGEGKSKEAAKLAADFLAGFVGVTKELQSAIKSPDISANLELYRGFLQAVERILVARQNTLLLRQATVFTTNYDLYVERASDFFPNLILNDGFDRRPNLAGIHMLRPERLFDSTFHTGRRYEYRAELPSLNLIKLHGSLSWAATENGYRFQAWNTASIEALALIGGDEENQSILNSAGVVLPNVTKHQKTTLEEIYYEQLRVFSNELDVENCLLIAFGFSFSDRHLTEILKRSLRNPTLWLVVPCFLRAEVEKLDELFNGFHNVTIIEPESDAEFDFSWLNGLLSSIVDGSI